MSLASRFRSGVFWNVTAAVFNQGSTFAVAIVLARMMGRARFGEFAVVLTTVQVSVLVFGLALGYTATKYVAEFRASDPVRAARVLGFGAMLAGVTAVLSAAALALGATLVASVAFDRPGLADLLRLGALVTPWMVLNGYFTGALAGLEDYRSISLAGVVGGTSYVIACVLMALRWGIPGAIVGMGVSGALQTGVLGLLLRAAVRRLQLPSLRASFGGEWSLVRRFALPGALGGVVTSGCSWLGTVILTRQSNGVSEIASYLVSFNLAAIVLFLPSVANGVGMSLLNHMRGSRDAQRYWRVLWSNLWLTALVAGSAACVLALLARPALALFGGQFSDATGVLRLLLMGTALEATTMALYQVVQSNERMWHGVRTIVLPRDLALPVAALALVPTYGALGLALAYAISRGIGFACALAIFLAHTDEVSLAGAPRS